MGHSDKQSLFKRKNLLLQNVQSAPALIQVSQFVVLHDLQDVDEDSFT